VPRLLGILLRPQATWQEIRAADAPWTQPLVRYALPLALLPSVAWPLGRAAGGLAAPGETVAAGFAATLLLTLACVLLFALGLFALASFFETQRSWSRAVAVACYSATPILLCGALLFVPILVVASVGGLLYALGVCALGVETVLGCKGSEVAGYVAGAAFFMGATSMALGALCSAIGWI
jgi:hypothetical protein